MQLLYSFLIHWCPLKTDFFLCSQKLAALVVGEYLMYETKYLLYIFSQLFGESVEDEDISPDAADPEAQTKSEHAKNEDAGDAEDDTKSKDESAESTISNGNVVRINTRQWAKDCNYDAAKLFNKFFNDDINYLLRMSNLWKSRKPPVPVQWDTLLSNKVKNEAYEPTRQHHKVWSIGECAQVFANALKALSNSFLKLESNDTLVWDKDDHSAMNFVAACANIRSHIFDIERKSCFEIKSMAGNIIPAIATTNAITAGISVMRAFSVLQAKWEQCKAVYARLRLNGRNQFLVPDAFFPAPNPNCYVCASDPAISLRIDTKRVQVKALRDEVLIKTLNMVNPDVTVESTGSIVISSEEGETECNETKLLSEMNIVDGVILKCDDFFQSYMLSIIIVHFDADRDDVMFEVIADKSQLQPKQEDHVDDSNVESSSRKRAANGGKVADDGPSTSKRSRPNVTEDDDDCLVVEDEADDDVKVTEMVTAATDKLSVESPAKATIKRKPREGKDSDEITEIFNSSDEDDAGPTRSKRSKLNNPDGRVEIISLD